MVPAKPRRCGRSPDSCDPREAAIVFAGREIHGREPAEILEAGIAHCPEGRRVFPHLTVDENLEMGAYVRRDRRAIGEDLERVCGHFPILRERRRQMAGTLSGGEQQMLAIGRALMARPRLILFDEPSLGLAPTVVETTFQIIAEIRQAGTTVLMVEQNAYLALRMADRGYVMETGPHRARRARRRVARQRPRPARIFGRLLSEGASTAPSDASPQLGLRGCLDPALRMRLARALSRLEPVQAVAQGHDLADDDDGGGLQGGGAHAGGDVGERAGDGCLGASGAGLDHGDGGIGGTPVGDERHGRCR